jgi:FAD/FMN-containing dehydrogenase
MHRRTVLTGLGALTVSSLSAASPGTASAENPIRQRVRPGDPAWPTAEDWAALKRAVNGRLISVPDPLGACKADARSSACAAELPILSNPFFIQDQPGGTETTGWVDAWETSLSVFAVVPRTAADVAAAVSFAREKNLRLVIKGGAHSYLGQSNAADSLLIWTRHLDKIMVHDAFVPEGSAAAPVPAVSVGAGARFLQLYTAVTTKGGRFVQGGGATSVGVGGHIQTGGFGSFSKFGGLAAASLLEAEIVTADGAVRTANASLNADLFWALKGGGAGFGVITRLTLATRPLPDRAGNLRRTVKARSSAGFQRLIAQFCAFAARSLINPHWGEQVSLTPDNELKITMVFQGLSDNAARSVWAPFWSWIDEHAADWAEVSPLTLVSAPMRHWWDFAYLAKNSPAKIVADQRPDAPPGQFWWAGDDEQVSVYISDYQSLWLPERLLTDGERPQLARALYSASRHHPVNLHFNKGLAGCTPERRAEARQTAINPAMLDAFALAIIAGGQGGVHPGLSGHEPDESAARAQRTGIDAAFRALSALVPDGGSYSSEMSYFAENWQEAAWGSHYERLLAIKTAYDPQGLFVGHHQVGSEAWSKDGFRQRN